MKRKDSQKLPRHRVPVVPVPFDRWRWLKRIKQVYRGGIRDVEVFQTVLHPRHVTHAATCNRTGEMECEKTTPNPNEECRKKLPADPGVNAVGFALRHAVQHEVARNGHKPEKAKANCQW